MTQMYWRALIEEDAHEAAGSGHLNRHGGLGELEDRQSLLAGHAGKPCEELVHHCSAFKILEENPQSRDCARPGCNPRHGGIGFEGAISLATRERGIASRVAEASHRDSL